MRKKESGSDMVNASVCKSAVALSSSPAVSLGKSSPPDVVLQGFEKFRVPTKFGLYVGKFG